MKLLKKILQEVLIENAQTKIFDQGSLNDIEKQIRKEVGILKDDSMMDQKVEYTEYRFGDGTGGFKFGWSHNRNQGGNLGVSLRKDGNHMLYTQSWYGKKKFGDENIKPKMNFMSNISSWKDLDNLTMQTIITQLKPMIKKNEVGAQKALDAEAKGQSDFYGSGGKGYYKQDGRIGAGL